MSMLPQFIGGQERNMSATPTRLDALSPAASQIAILIGNHYLNTPIHRATIRAAVVGDWVGFAVALRYDAGGIYAACDQRFADGFGAALG
jgi:hypothetical protein